MLTFLARYCETVKGGEHLKDHFGIWTGKRRYLVKLRVDLASPGGLFHPTGSFFIGSNRGFLHYPGRTVYCRRCGAQGHVKADCAGQQCCFCGSSEHVATDCPEPKRCSFCGGKEHLLRSCPNRQKTYASLFKKGQDLQTDFEGLLATKEKGQMGRRGGKLFWKKLNLFWIGIQGMGELGRGESGRGENGLRYQQGRERGRRAWGGRGVCETWMG